MSELKKSDGSLISEFFPIFAHTLWMNKSIYAVLFSLCILYGFITQAIR